MIDDDAALRSLLLSLLRSLGFQAMAFGSAAEFLCSHKPDVPSCLVLDVRLPGVGGIEFQAELAKANFHIPIIFITGYGDIPMTVRAMRAGAVEFLTKPFRDQDLLDAVRLGLDRDSARREREQALSCLVSAYETLTVREKEVFPHVTNGLMNKQIGCKLGDRRDHGQGASEQGDAENGREVVPCPCEDGRASRHWAAKELTENRPVLHAQFSYALTVGRLLRN